jgi:hypothetical protein
MSEQAKLAEKMKLKGRSDHTIQTDADEVTLFVDLDDPKTEASTERHSGLTLTKVCVVQGGQKLHFWLNLECVGFAMDADRGFRVVLTAAKSGGGAEAKVHATMSQDGFELGDK